MKKTIAKTTKKAADPKPAAKQTDTKAAKDKKPAAPKFGVLGKDLSNQFTSRGNNFFRPTKPGGRNGQGKP